MSIENIKEGKITESALVELFGSESQKKSYEDNGRFIGSYKTALFKKLSRHCEIREVKKNKNGEKLYIITKVYDYPLPANFSKMQKSIYKYIVPLILNSLINGHDKNNSIEITVGKWAREINMVNNNYALVKYNREDSSKETQIRLDTINEFYDRADHMINWYITNALDYLKSAGLIIWREVNRITVEKIDGKPTVDHNGNVKVDIDLITHRASKDEIEFYFQCVAIADKEADIENAGERYYSKKSQRFQEILRRELYTRKIKYVYSTYEAYYVHLDKCKALLEHFDDVSSKHLIDDFNREFSRMIIENAGKRFEKNAMKYPYKNKQDYLSLFECLCEITIDNQSKYLGEQIRKRDMDDNYNLLITHKHNEVGE